jgi:hypothetical protein
MNVVSITVEWDNPQKTVVRYIFSRGWTWADYHNSIQRAVELVADIPYTVNMIIDLSNSSLLPSNILNTVGNSMRHSPKPYDLAVIVTTNRFVESIIDILQRVYPAQGAKHPCVKTLEEARAMLAEHDRKRTDLPVNGRAKSG